MLENLLRISVQQYITAVMSLCTTLTVLNVSARQYYILIVTNLNYLQFHYRSLNTVLKNRGAPKIQILCGHFQRHHKFSITATGKTVGALTAIILYILQNAEETLSETVM